MFLFQAVLAENRAIDVLETCTHQRSLARAPNKIDPRANETSTNQGTESKSIQTAGVLRGARLQQPIELPPPAIVRLRVVAPGGHAARSKSTPPPGLSPKDQELVDYQCRRRVPSRTVLRLPIGPQRRRLVILN